MKNKLKELGINPCELAGAVHRIRMGGTAEVLDRLGEKVTLFVKPLNRTTLDWAE